MKTSSGKQKSSKDSIEGLGLHQAKRREKQHEKIRMNTDAELRDLDLPRR